MIEETAKNSKKRQIFAWSLYDWANTAYGTVIITFVYSVYFARGIIGDETHGSALWSYTIGVSGLMIALSGPVLGALADHYGGLKRFVFVSSMVCIAATALLWFGTPDAGTAGIWYVLVLLALGNVGFELGQVFYNTLLPHIAPAGKIGRASGMAWAMGYFGGLCCLVLTLTLLIGIGDMAPVITLPQESAAHIRASAPVVALWFFIFMLPLFFFVPDIARTGIGFTDAGKAGARQIVSTFRAIRQQGNLVKFLIGSALYRDGLTTLFAVGGLYAAGVYGLDYDEILLFAIGLNVTAGLGAGLFSYMDDFIGSRRTIMIALVALLFCGSAILFINDKMLFIVTALVLGLFVGPAQAAGRTFAARLTASHMVSQTFGLYAFTGKSIAFLGPLAYGAATSVFETQKAGMVTVLLFWLAGLCMIYLTKEARDED